MNEPGGGEGGAQPPGTQDASERAASARPSTGARSLLRDRRLWLGFAVTVLSIGWAGRGIPVRDVTEAMAGVDFFALLILSAPFYTLSVWVRALRWRLLTAPIAPMSRRVLFRSESIGFMVNNLLPLRIGEVVRSWTLARDTHTSFSAVFGTVVLERVLDAVSVLALAGAALAWAGASSAVGGILAEGSLLLWPVAVVPLALLIALRTAPELAVRTAERALQPLPEVARERLVRLLRGFIAGLGALRGGAHLFWIVLHSATIWLLLSAAPLWVGLWAFGIDLGSPIETLFSSWILLGAVGVAVALPSAPGFIGPYQLAFKAVLVRFGVEPATALAMGVLVWFVFWLTLTLQGLLFLRPADRRVFDLARQVR